MNPMFSFEYTRLKIARNTSHNRRNTMQILIIIALGLLLHHLELCAQIRVVSLYKCTPVLMFLTWVLEPSLGCRCAPAHSSASRVGLAAPACLRAYTRASYLNKMAHKQAPFWVCFSSSLGSLCGLLQG